MDPDRWQQIEEVFHLAAEASIDERPALMDVLCGDDQELRAEVETLLAEEHQDGFIRDAISNVAKSYAGQQKHELDGKQIGHYQILSKLHTGGMGTVYLAEDTKFNRRVALKVLPQLLAKHPDHVRRFQREARSISLLSHPNIIAVFDAGEVEGCPYLVMEYVEGITLRDKIHEKPMPVDEIVPVSLQIASALNEAHRAGIIHRDITSKNVMIAGEGTVKVLDFGVAKAMATSGLHSGTLTRSGVVVGTVQFMSPEQATGKPVDHRTDLFSFGIVMFEMTTGHLPFQGRTVIETIHSIVHSDPANGLAQAHPDLKRIILKCLEKDRQKRYSNTRQLCRDLTGLGRQLNIPLPQRDNQFAGILVRWLARTFRIFKS